MTVLCIYIPVEISVSIFTAVAVSKQRTAVDVDRFCTIQPVMIAYRPELIRRETDGQTDKSGGKGCCAV
jgi:hypothetical protein